MNIFKHLGVVFDQIFNWREQIHKLIYKASNFWKNLRTTADDDIMVILSCRDTNAIQSMVMRCKGKAAEYK